jgi:ATP-dependent exoDNAse (exonuclease V) alpha subunit
MTIYHFNAKVISRKAGQSSIATAAYNAREKLTDERTGEIKDFRRKDGLIFSGIYAPKDAPEWTQDRGELWNRAEAAEKRKDSTIARNYEIALPHELNEQQQRYLIQDFIKENFTRKGYVADLSFHAPDKDSDNRNFHAHILVTDRRIEADGFAPNKSERQLKSNGRKGDLKNLRESWERHGNRYLERHGFEPSLDRRTLEAQGIDREPTRHKGANVSAMEKKGIKTDRGEQARQVEARNSELKILKLEAAKIAQKIREAESARTAQQIQQQTEPEVKQDAKTKLDSGMQNEKQPSQALTLEERIEKTRQERRDRIEMRERGEAIELNYDSGRGLDLNRHR